MDHLLRSLAPVSDIAWDLIEAEATRTVRHNLAGRSLIGVTGPLGWEHGGPTTGRLQVELPQLVEGVDGVLRAVRPLVELRTPFEVPRDELDAADRGAPDPDLSAVIDASRRAALAEDRAVFHGCEPAGIAGMLAGSRHDPVPIREDYDECGDFSIGYRSHSEAAVELYLEEAVTFVVRDDRAAVALVYQA
jgi:uncharacterized linocin/CFP29 family protein